MLHRHPFTVPADCLQDRAPRPATQSLSAAYQKPAQLRHLRTSSLRAAALPPFFVPDSRLQHSKYFRPHSAAQPHN